MIEIKKNNTKLIPKILYLSWFFGFSLYDVSFSIFFDFSSSLWTLDEEYSLTLESNFFIEEKLHECPFLYFSNSISAGTIKTDRIKVLKIPINRVIPTVLIGAIGTNSFHVRTLNPIIVVSAERRMAFPVVIIAITVDLRLISGSKGSSENSCWSFILDNALDFNRFVRFSSILFVRWSE